MYYVDEHIKNTNRVFPQQGRYDYLRYDMNENPEGLPKKFVDSVLKEITPEFLSIYPEPDRFLNKYAAYIGASYENVVAVNGSDMGIRYLLETFGEKGKDVVTVAPSFEMYWVNCSILGLHHVPVAYEPDMTISIDKILDAITENTRIVVLLNPNNPIGNVYTEDELEKVIEKTKKVGAIVIIDEAYHYFYPKTFIQYALNERHVFVTRTFSKLFSMAGCRLGYVVGHPDDIKYVQKFCTPHNTNAFAMLFAERILTTPGMVESLVRKFQEGRSYLISELDDRGYHHKGEAGNFLFIEPKTKAQTIVERMKNEKKILIKAYENVGEFGDCLRVSIGEKKYMQQFMVALLELDK